MKNNTVCVSVFFPIFVILYIFYSQISDGNEFLDWLEASLFHSNSLITESSLLLDGASDETDIELIKSNLNLVLKKKPLSSEAFYQYSQLEARFGNLESSQNLLYAAFKRGPRNKKVLAKLLQLELQNSNHHEAIELTDILIRLDNKNRSLYIDILVLLGDDEANKAKIKDLLLSSPNWQEEFFIRKIQNLKESDVFEMQKLIESVASQNLQVKNEKKVREAFLTRLISINMFDDSFSIWSNWMSLYQNINDNQKELYVQDPDFNGNLNLLPFGWFINKGDENLMIERLPRGGIAVKSNSKSPTKLISQLLPSIPNEPFLHYSVDDLSNPYSSGLFQIRLFCFYSNEMVFSTGIEAHGSKKVKIVDETGCEAYKFEVWALPVNHSYEASMTLKSLNILEGKKSSN